MAMSDTHNNDDDKKKSKTEIPVVKASEVDSFRMKSQVYLLKDLVLGREKR